MKKELIWNISLLLFGVFIVLAFSMSYVMLGFNMETNFPYVGLGNKILTGLAFGTALIVFRYLHIGILSITHKDLRLLLLLLGYMLPLLFVLVEMHYQSEGCAYDFHEEALPTMQLKKLITEVRKAGLFKAYPDLSDDALGDLVIGRAVSQQGGRIDAAQYWDATTRKVYLSEILRLDTEKVLPLSDLEIIVEGNHAYESVIRQLGTCSEGHFKPNEIKEFWAAPEKIVLSFNANGKEHIIYPKVNDDWADLDSILAYLNTELLTNSDYKFYVGVDCDVLVVFLSKKEKETLSAASGIAFELASR